MRTLLVSGSDTGVGKTWVTATLAARLAARGCSVQVVKPVETGIEPGATGDAEWVQARCASARVSASTLRRFAAPIAPLAAAEKEGATFCIEDLVTDIERLPEADWRVLEGAGSIAVPLDKSGRDWTDFALAARVERVVLVVADQLGAIGQARMAVAYAERRGLKAGVWLNEVSAQRSETRAATHAGMRDCGVPLWGVQREGEAEADFLEEGLLFG